MRIAVYQGEPVIDGFNEARSRLPRICTEATQRKANLLVLPEMFTSGYNIGVQQVRAAASSPAGPTVNFLTNAATEHRIGILCGFAELAADGRIHNSAALIDAQGSLRAVCRKTHLFGDVDRAQFSAGDALCPVLDFDGWKVGLAICYDVEFPELVRAQALAGAEIILTPTANMLPYTGVATRIVPARAEENEIFMVYANYVGTEGEFDYCGLSCIVGPDGEDIARAGTEAEMICDDVTRAQLKKVRAVISHLRDRRADIYPPQS